MSALREASPHAYHDPIRASPRAGVQSIRKWLSQAGSYFGIRPSKLPNGKLRWSSDGAELLLKGATK